MALPPKFEARLASARMLSDNVRELHFERVDGAPFEFDAGQWVNLRLPLPDGELKRAYSIASPPDGSAGFDVAVTRVQGGPGSSFLHALPVGDTLDVIGPQGFFTRPLASAAPSLFVATGTGIAPFRSMIHTALGAPHPMPMSLVFGVRHEGDILYREELERLTRANDALKVAFTLSRGGPAWAGRRGYVQTHVRDLWSELEGAGRGTPHIYVCGLARMVGAVRDLARKDMRLPRELVHTERYD